MGNANCFTFFKYFMTTTKVGAGGVNWDMSMLHIDLLMCKIVWAFYSNDNEQASHGKEENVWASRDDGKGVPEKKMNIEL